MNTFREAPSRAALQNAAPTPASLIARAETFAQQTLRSGQWPHSTLSMISMGTEQASFENDLHDTSLLSLLFLGVLLAYHMLWTGARIPLHLSQSDEEALSEEHLPFLSAHTSPLLHPHISFCRRSRLPTMFPRAVPMAPTRAEAPPPPGTGALDASTSTNSLQGTVENPIIHTS